MHHVRTSRAPEPDDQIVSARNRLVREIARLRLTRERRLTGTLAAEGPQTLSAALVAGVRPSVVLFGAAAGERHRAMLAEARVRGARLVLASEPVLQRLCYRDDPEGVVAVLPLPGANLGDVQLPTTPLVVVVESLEKPGNLGAIVRTACAAGAHAVVVCDAQTDPFSPAAVRASLGTVFQIPLAVSSSTGTLAWLREGGVRVVAATPNATLSYWDADMRPASAVAVGNERRGLTRQWLDAADTAIRIPMPGPTDSLNATTATGVVLWEALRQRGTRGA